MKPQTIQAPLHSELKLSTEMGPFFGDVRVRLLEAIERLGSLSKAAKSLPLSYKAAWDALDGMNNLAEQPLVVRSVGGKNGGGTYLTPYGLRMVAMYRALEAEYQLAVARLHAACAHDGESLGDVAEYRRLLRRFAMKSSARNQFLGVISAVVHGPVDVEVTLQLDGGQSLLAVVTRESAENLNLVMGQQVYALIKSSSVMLVNEPNLRLSARNQLHGEITRIERGPVNSEVTLAMPGGKCLCAVITTESVQEMGLDVGVTTCAAFKASAVLLCSLSD